MSVCEHLAADRAPVELDPPGGRSCVDCVREGTQWVHLRACLDCGHVGCCDNSPRKHATGHFAETSHPVMTSTEPGEAWAWCYVDEVAAETA